MRNRVFTPRFASRQGGVYYLAMDELEISGKRYISTRRAAREHGYHSDYMGQLIRGKKVAGQKVGRAWYIEEESLNVYLGKAPAPQPKVAPVVAEAVAASAPEPAPAPVERLIIEEPQPVVVQPAPVLEVIAPESMYQAPQVVEVPPAVQAKPVAVRVAAPQESYAQPQQKIYHAPYIEEERATRIPIHTPAPVADARGGLRYAADDYAVPMVTRMPQNQPAPTARATVKGTFPYMSLSVVAVLAILAATFASNFISATIVSEEGKPATVQYAIHW